MTKISDVRKSPMDYFKLSKEKKKEVYVLNNNSVAGVMIDKNRSALVSEKDVLGNRLDHVQWSENDGWE